MNTSPTQAADVIAYHIEGLVNFYPLALGGVLIALVLGYFLHKRLQEKE